MQLFLIDRITQLVFNLPKGKEIEASALWSMWTGAARFFKPANENRMSEHDLPDDETASQAVLSPFASSLSRALHAELTELNREGVQLPEPVAMLVGLSGGVDSTALLVALNMLKSQFNWRLVACHINHRLRGKDSDEDEEFCRRLCDSLAVEFVSIRLDAPKGRDYPSENLLRERRYEKLLETAKEHAAKIILTAHTLDDQAETMLFRLLRGTSPAGLTGMDARRELQQDEGVYLIRPLLGVRKTACERFLASQQMGHRVDLSNFDDRFARNFIRTNLIPEIDKRFPGWQERTERLRTILHDDEDYLSRLTDEAMKKLNFSDREGEYILLEPCRKLALPLQRRIMARLFERHGVEPNFQRIELVLALIDEGSGAVSLSSTCEARVSSDKLRWLNPDHGENGNASAFMRTRQTVIRLPDGDKSFSTNVISWLNKSLQVEKLARPLAGASAGTGVRQGFPAGHAFEILVDLTHVQEPLTLRTRRPGDVIQPFGMSELVRLKKYLHTHKNRLADTRVLMETAERPGGGFEQEQSRAVVLVDTTEVLWVPGVGLSEKLRVKDRPTHSLKFIDLNCDRGVIA